jgi:hypothetical protein
LTLKKEPQLYSSKQPFHGFVSITDNGLAYDNTLYFTISKNKRRISFVLARPKQLSKSVYTDSEFNFVNSTISSLDYNSIEKQDVIVLNELDDVFRKHCNDFTVFVENGGNLIVIPSEKTQRQT